jgi:hypothetical protein
MNFQHVAGCVIHHVAASTQQYVGCPSIAILADGTYISSHSYFGPGAANTDSSVYASTDGGETW